MVVLSKSWEGQVCEKTATVLGGRGDPAIPVTPAALCLTSVPPKRIRALESCTMGVLSFIYLFCVFFAFFGAWFAGRKSQVCCWYESVQLNSTLRDHVLSRVPTWSFHGVCASETVAHPNNPVVTHGISDHSAPADVMGSDLSKYFMY